MNNLIIVNEKKVSPINWVLITLITILLFIFKSTILYHFKKYLNINSSNNSLNGEITYEYLLLNLIIFSIIAPFFEEVIFRLSLKFSNLQQIILGCFFILNLIITYITFGTQSPWLFVSQLFLLFLSIVFFAHNKFKDKVQYANYIFTILSVFTFSAAHILKFEMQDLPNGLLIFLVYTLISGLPTSIYFTYLRIKYKFGFEVAYFAHGFFNSITLFILLFFKLFNLL